MSEPIYRNEQTKVIAAWLAREGREIAEEIMETVLSRLPEEERNTRIGETVLLTEEQLQAHARARWVDGMMAGTLRDLVACALNGVDWKALAANLLIAAQKE